VPGAGGRYWPMQLLKRCSMPLLYWHEVIKGRA